MTPAAPDPVSTLCCFDPDGAQRWTVGLPGQLQLIAADADGIWVSGFRRSRQADVMTALRPDGSVRGEVSFAAAELPSPPPAQPRRRPQLPLPEQARATRELVEYQLSEPRQASNRFGETWEEPSISREFRLDRVELRGTDEEPQVAVLFRWAAEDDLFGLRFDVGPWGNPYIPVYVQENLLACGYGVANAIREPDGEGVTWLHWPLRGQPAQSE
jgi:hypothetical protein